MLSLPSFPWLTDCRTARRLPGLLSPRLLALPGTARKDREGGIGEAVARHWSNRMRTSDVESLERVIIPEAENREG